MSFEGIVNFWLATRDDLEDVLLREKVVQQLKPTKNRLEVHRVFASLYPRYVVLCNNLSELLDQTLQVQKRAVIEKLLEAATNRLLDLYKQLSEIELSEFIYVDRALVEFKLLPEDVQLLKPSYFPMRRRQEIQDLIDEVRPEEEGEKEEEPLTGLDKFRKRLTPEEEEQLRIKNILIDAVNLIKRHEKSRQARIWRFNIERDPEKYKPRLPEPSETSKYEFYHKPDTPLLYPIRRTVWESNFYQELVSFSDFDFYRKPGTPALPKKQKKRVSFPDEPELSLEEPEIEERPSFAQKKVREEAANRIQRAWFRYQIRKRAKQRRLKRLLFLGLADDRKLDYSADQRVEEFRNRRRLRKSAFDAQFAAAIEDERARIVRIRTPWIMEDISDHIRGWFREFYDGAGDFHRYPEAFEGGTILVLRGETMTLDEYRAKKAEEVANKAKTPEQRAKDKAKAKEEKEKLKEKRRLEREKEKEMAARRKELERQGELPFDFKDLAAKSKGLTNLDATVKDFEKNWAFIDEIGNSREEPIMDWISIDRFADLHKELRPIVDEMMRIEFELLRIALAKDLKKKYKPQKAKKQKKPKGKKKGRRKKKEIDFLEENTLEELYQELKDLEIIQKYEKASLDNFIGDVNFTAYDKRIKNEDPPPSLGDLKSLLRTLTLGMSSFDFPKPKSILLAGPPGAGKRLLVRSICSELDAVIFDLSAEKVAQVPDLRRLVALVAQMSRLLQPSVIFVNGAHRPYYRRIPPAEKELDPKRLGKLLSTRLVKPIKRSDRVLVLGTSDTPWLAKAPALRKCFERILLVPRTDYGSGFLLWRRTLLAQMGVPRTIDVSGLALVTRGQSAGRILEAVEACLGLRRRMRFARKPLEMAELLEYFLEEPPKYPMADKEFEKYLKWYRKTNKLAKKRQALLKTLQETTQKGPGKR